MKLHAPVHSIVIASLGPVAVDWAQLLVSICLKIHHLLRKAEQLKIKRTAGTLDQKGQRSSLHVCHDTSQTCQGLPCKGVILNSPFRLVLRDSHLKVEKNHFVLLALPRHNYSPAAASPFNKTI
jgi:hypothetical protein